MCITRPLCVCVCVCVYICSLRFPARNARPVLSVACPAVHTSMSHKWQDF